ncbi:unnamed protein product [Cladocopium goreaui]|uniref:Uncharacterized protein n=1 Tax=Cladocopium goreaui TaxID=2562237 RepID=A0A9P1FS82_9DINO|nr:unnamed protein product [Cladocopium goreaui]
MAWDMPKRRLFEDVAAKGQLVEDTVLLSIEAELPAGLPTARELLHWGAQDRSPQEHAQYSDLAVMCKDRLIQRGRGARVLLDSPGGNAKVQLSDGATCEVFPYSKPTAEGVVAILKMPPGNDILEIRYRSDESVEVRSKGTTSPRTVRRPRTSDWLRETGGWHIQAPGPSK